MLSQGPVDTAAVPDVWIGKAQKHTNGSSNGTRRAERMASEWPKRLEMVKRNWSVIGPTPYFGLD